MPQTQRATPASGKLKITIDLDDGLNANEIRILKTYLTGDGGIEEWVKGMILGKINSRKKAMLAPKGEFIQILKDDGITALPIDEDALVAMILDHPNYKDRVTRDAEATAAVEAAAQ